ncbi:MAG: nickel-dependent lactate racemase [Acidobacteriota bacterium]
MLQQRSTSSRECSIALGYGRDYLPFHFDPERFSVLVPNNLMSERLTDAEIDQGFTNPIDSSSFEEIFHSKDQVLIVVPDATRAAGTARIVPLIVSKLNQIGIKDENISILIGGGIHRLPTRQEISNIVGDTIAERLSVYPHDARDPAATVYLGETSKGTPVEINRRLTQTDHVIITGAISFHYCAGFSGGRKIILPGCASERSVQSHHLLAFDRDRLYRRAGVATRRLEGNPVHENILEAAAMLNPAFLVNTVINNNNEVAALFAGHWRNAHLKGCHAYDASHTIAVKNRRPLVIVSCAGLPRDVNLIQAHKAIEHASGIVAEGGTMILLAECSQGLGYDRLLDWFLPGGAQATAMRLAENYHVNGQSAWELRNKAERFRIILISSLPEDLVCQLGIEPYRSLEAAISQVTADSGYILPNGIITFPYLEAETD